MNITIYTTNTCAYCEMVKKYLTSKGLTYNEINVDEQPEKREEAYNLSGALTVPVTAIYPDFDNPGPRGKEGRPKVITGWKPDLLAKAIA